MHKLVIFLARLRQSLKFSYNLVFHPISMIHALPDSSCFLVFKAIITSWFKCKKRSSYQLKLDTPIILVSCRNSKYEIHYLRYNWPKFKIWLHAHLSAYTHNSWNLGQNPLWQNPLGQKHFWTKSHRTKFPKIKSPRTKSPKIRIR